MGEVYKARDTRLDRAVAIKVLNSALVASPELKARFEREARAISQLNHPHICVLYDIGTENGAEFLVMEFLDGNSLADRIASKAALPVAELVRIGCEIADALDKAHRAGIAHRDLKPGNIMLTRTGAKLLDFGLAKPIAGSAPQSAAAPLLTAAVTMTTPIGQTAPLTEPGVLLGTMQYMSPEQIKGMEADARSDIFALGAVLYEMATGKRAFEGKSRIKVASSILEDQPQPITAVRKTMPGALDWLIRACLAKNPDDRFQSALDVKLALARIGELSEAAAMPVAKPRRKQMLPWAAAAMLLLTALAAFLSRPSAAPAQRIVAHLTSPGGFAFDIAGDRGAPPGLSPDGKKLVFGAGGKLWLRQLDQENARELDGTQAATFPFWSADSRSIGYFQGGKLRTMQLQEGSVTTVCDAPNPRGGSWSAGGYILFTPTLTSPIMKVATNGGNVVAVTSLKSGITTHRWPQVLPDGKHFLYFAATHAKAGAGDQTGMYAASIEGGAPVLLLHLPVSGLFADGKFFFLRGTALMEQAFDGDRLRLTGEPQAVQSGVGYDRGVWRGTFSVADNGVLLYSGGDPSSHFLQWFGSNGEPEKNMVEPGSYTDSALSPNGTRFAGVNDPQGDLWVIDFNGGARVRLAERNAANPVWSPGEGQLAYARLDNAGIPKMMVRSSDGSGGERAVIAEPVAQIPSDWSPEGRYILYDRGSTGNSDIWAVPVKPDAKPFPVVQSEAGAWDYNGHFSPDGKWIVFSSIESGTNQVYVTAFPGPGPKWQVSQQTGGAPRWSPDGKWICFWNGAHNVLLKVPVTERADRPVFGGEKPFINGMVYEPPFNDADYSLARDGRLLVNRVADQNQRLTIVTDWKVGATK